MTRKGEKFMTYQIDQSGKIEQTAKDTILCLANGGMDSVLIKAKTKRQIQEIFRRHGQIRNFVLFSFCAGLSLLLKKNLKIGKVMIDREYFGKEPVIKNILEKMLGKNAVSLQIEFGLIGKNSHAHFLAKKVAAKKKKTRIIKFEEILGEIKKTEVGNRLKDA